MVTLKAPGVYKYEETSIASWVLYGCVLTFERGGGHKQDQKQPHTVGKKAVIKPTWAFGHIF